MLTQTQFCARRLEQPPTENTIVDHRSSILSLIKDDGSCSLFVGLTAGGTSVSRDLSACDRPIQAVVDKNEFFDNELALCMVLYDTAKRVCKMKNQDFTNFIQKHISSKNLCDTMNRTFPESLSEETGWVSLLRARFEHTANCEKACLDGNVINPVCIFILRANMFIMGKQLPPADSEGEFCLLVTVMGCYCTKRPMQV
jgi:hypothetical protein